MKRAHQYREYRNVTDFQAPDGIVSVEVDSATGQLATAACPATRTEVFISGTQPVEICQVHGHAGGTRVANWESPATLQQPPPVGAPSPTSRAPGGPRAAVQPPPPQQPEPQSAQKEAEKKKGFLGRILGVFK